MLSTITDGGFFWFVKQSDSATRFSTLFWLKSSWANVNKQKWFGEIFRFRDDIFEKCLPV